MKQNEGLSLIELIVIIAIMTVLISVVGISMTVISRQKVSNAAEDVKVLFQTAQTIAMSKDNCHIAISQNSSNETVFTLYSSVNNNELNKVTLNKKVEVSILVGGSTYNIENVDVVRIYYDRVSGSFDKMYWSGNSTLSGESGKGDEIPGNGITGIKFSNTGGSSEITIKLTKLTGRVSY